MSEQFSKSMQKRIEHQVGEKLYTTADLERARVEAAQAASDMTWQAAVELLRMRFTNPPESRSFGHLLDGLLAEARLEEAKWWDEHCGFPGRGGQDRQNHIAQLEAEAKERK